MKFDGRELSTDHHAYEFEKLYLSAIQPKSDAAALAAIAQEILAKDAAGNESRDRGTIR
jgi:hypothetical protein